MARRTTSPFALFLCAIFLFSANVLAVSAVLGVDLGTGYIKAALVKPGIPLEIVLTKDARRKESSSVAFKPSPNGPKAGSYPERYYGSDAMALAPRFPGDVYPNLKALLGLPADHAAVKEYAAQHPALKLEAHGTTGTAAFKSSGAFTAEEEAWLVEELLAMELQSIRTNAEALAGSGSSVRSVVLTVPPFYTAEERRAVELAADLAGLRVLALINDNLAVGLHYATSRQFPTVNEGGKPEYHMIFDMGAGSTKTGVLRFQSRTVKDIGKFNKTVQEVQVLGSGWDRELGGDTLNSLIVEDMIAKFVESPKAQKASVAIESVKAHGRAVAKLTKEAERLRHILSANTNTQTSFEGLYDDVDFKYKISRAEFEGFAEKYVQRVAVAIQDALDAAGLQVSDLDSVILHGGASRTPFIQKELEKIFGDAEKIRNSVNADEAAVFGAGFKAAEISPSFRVKEIRAYEPAGYPAGLKWTDEKQKLRHQRLWTATSPLGAAPKELTLPVVEDFSASFYQLIPASDAEGTVEAETKSFATKNLTATVEHLVEKHGCEKADIRFKMGVRLAAENGEVEVTKAGLECEVDEPEKEGFVDGVKNLFGFGKKDQQPLKGDEEETEEAGDSSSKSTTSDPETSTSTSTSSSTTTTTTSSGSASASADSEPKEKKKQLVTIPVDYTLERAGRPALAKSEISTLKDRLKAFESSDRSRRLREESLNQLEGLTYRIKDFLENEEFIAASTSKERQDLETKGNEASDWLYGDGADAPRDELRSRFKELQDIISPVQKRIEEGTKRPELVTGLQDALKQTSSFIESVKKSIAEFEEFESSRIASSASSTSTTTDTTSTVTEAPTADEFDGLEDDDATASTTASPEMEDVLKERGPVPPMYTLEDLKETEDLYASVSAWLEGKLAEQEKLGPTDDAVLLTKDLIEKREKLDKVGLDLAMKGVRNFEKKKKSSSSKTKTKTKTKSSKTAKSKKPASTIEIKPDADGKFPSEEELAEMLKQYSASASADEAPPQATDAKAEDNERKHEEL